MEKHLTLYLPLGLGKEAVVIISIFQEGLGALDAPMPNREPSASELGTILKALTSISLPTATTIN